MAEGPWTLRLRGGVGRGAVDSLGAMAGVMAEAAGRGKEPRGKEPGGPSGHGIPEAVGDSRWDPPGGRRAAAGGVGAPPGPPQGKRSPIFWQRPLPVSVSFL